MTPTRFRYGPAAKSAAGIFAVGTLALAGQSLALLPLLLVPLLALAWVFRAGVDVSDEGLRVRALVGSRLVLWSQVTAMSMVGSHVLMHVDSGGSFRLPAVPRADLPRLFAAGKQGYDATGQPGADATGGVQPGSAEPPVDDQ